MTLRIPLPFGELEIVVRGSRRARPMFWFTLLSILLHTLALWVLGMFLFRALVPVPQFSKQPLMVAISSALRIEPRAHPVPAHQPVPRPRAVAPHPRTLAARPAAKPHRPELTKRARVAYAQPQSQALTPAQIDSQTRAFEQTIAQARAAADPVAGAANDAVRPAAPKPYRLNIQGDFGKPQPEGVLYPMKRWVDGAYVYYYVRYSVEYADGSSETGVVPWPIRFPEGADPFARGIHRMPLPGPLPDYVLPDDVAMTPLIKNCLDHHYDYCPIEHE